MTFDTDFELAKIAARSLKDCLRQVEKYADIKTLELQIRKLKDEEKTLDPFLSSCATGNAIDKSILLG